MVEIQATRIRVLRVALRPRNATWASISCTGVINGGRNIARHSAASGAAGLSRAEVLEAAHA
jgi:hypothetical protein